MDVWGDLWEGWSGWAEAEEVEVLDLPTQSNRLDFYHGRGPQRNRLDFYEERETALDF
jgi:hypothetical protein